MLPGGTGAGGSSGSGGNTITDGSADTGGTAGTGGQVDFDGGPIIVDASAPGIGTTLIGGPGASHTCALRVDGSLVCWGSNYWDALGIGAEIVLSGPVVVAGPGEVSLAALSGGVTCVASSSGETRCWGRFWNLGATIDGGQWDLPNPWSPDGLGSVRSMVGGVGHMCGVTTDGEVRCVGSIPTWTRTTTAMAVSGLNGATAVAVGNLHTCAIVAGGNVSCWGSGDFGQLGNGQMMWSSQPVSVAGVSGATAIAAGYFFTCALVAGGMVTCWGDNSAGTLGTQTPSLESPTPVMVQGIAGATAIAAGGGHVCALVGDKAWCWGYLLDGTSSSSPVPRAVSGVEGVTSLAAGVEHVCAVVGTGAVVCWGRNIDGELGTTTAGPYSGPVTVTGWP